MPPARNKLSLSVQYADTRLKERLPRTLIRKWVAAALFAPAELAIRLVDADEGRTLNREYRGKDYSTNVLTFAYGDDDGFGESDVTQADIVLCADVLLDEAKAQGKTLEAHAAHLVVHGVLHAQGYDHEDDAEAAEMESLEIEILAALGLDNPYET